MEVGIAQSQTLIASVSVSTSLTAQVTKPQASALPVGLAPEADRVEVSQLDAGYAQKVLRDSLVDSLDAAAKKAGLDINAEGLLSSGLDMSPQATAKRIVDFATSFYDAYKSNHKLADGLDPKEARTQSLARLDGFVSLIRGAVKEGFSGAQDVLSNLGPMSQEVQGGIDKTFELAMKGLDEFAAREREALAEAGADGPELAEVL
jgi:hypothetical protein